MMEDAKPVTMTIRSAMPSDYELCMAIDHTISTEQVWQMMIDDSEDCVRITFRPVRLPRSTKVLYPRSGEELLQSWRLHAAFLVAEAAPMVVGYANVREVTALWAPRVADHLGHSSYRRPG